MDSLELIQIAIAFGNQRGDVPVVLALNGSADREIALSLPLQGLDATVNADATCFGQALEQ